jgi:hypothetical protein
MVTFFASALHRCAGLLSARQSVLNIKAAISTKLFFIYAAEGPLTALA